MKTIFKSYELQTNGKILHVSLKALFRAVGLDGELVAEQIPVSVLDKLYVGLLSPYVSGVKKIKAGLGANTYSVDGDQLTVRVTNLPAGVSHVVIGVQYGTNAPAILDVSLHVAQNVPFLHVDGTYTPLVRLAEKDEEVSGVMAYAYAYYYGDVVVWFEGSDKLDYKAKDVTAFVADGISEAEFLDATENHGQIVNNACAGVYDEESDIDFGATDQFGATPENNLLIGTQEEREAYADPVAGLQWNEVGDNGITRYIYNGTEWEEIKGGNLLIGSQEDREALVDPIEGLEFNQVDYDEVEAKYTVRRFVRENGEWVELESPQTETVETVSLHVSTYDGQGTVTGVQVAITDNNTHEILHRTLDESGNCMFDIPKGHTYTIAVGSLSGYRDIPDQTYTAAMDERTINLVYLSETLDVEIVNVHITVYNSALQDITSQDVDFIGQQIICTIEGAAEPLTATVGSDHTCRFEIPYGSVYTIDEPTKSGYMRRYSTHWSHTAGVPQRTIPMHYAQWVAAGIYGVDAAGHTYTHEDIQQMSTAEREAIIAIMVNTSTLSAAGAGFYYKVPKSTTSAQWASANVEFDQSLLPFKQNHAAAVLDLDGETNTENIIAIGDTEGIGTPAADWCAAQTLTIADETKNGFLGSYGQLYALVQNLTEINAIHTLLDVAALGINSGYWWTSTQSNATNAVNLYNGGFYHNTKNTSRTTIALFAL